MKRVFAIRGATKALNDEADMVNQIALLYDALLGGNGLAESDIVSLIFSVTGDLRVKNPAAALRQSGRAGGIALFSTQEPESVGAPAGVVRMLLHAYMDEGRSPAHVFRNGAEALRPDWAGGNGR
jgi:chorismate mutase